MTADHGAAAQRTRLAWRRTALSAAAVVLLAARPAFRPGAGTASLVLAAVAMTGWAALAAVGRRRAVGLERDPPVPGRRAVTACAAATVVLAVIGGLIVTADP